jgi:hypothetical protein
MIKEHILRQLVRDNLLHDKFFKTKVSAGYDKPIFKRSLENKKDKRQVTRSRCIKIIKTHLKLT